ncbi:MAG: Nudix family hydrolase [Aquisalimonadaceae bacterium]
MAVGVVVDSGGRVLIARRPEGAHQGGRWEFPGGKVEAGESVLQALDRELHEELGVSLHAASPLIRIPHHYPGKSVLLDVWRVTAFTGEPHGREGQPLRWVSPGQLAGYRFPDANRAIVTAASLPDRYLITPEPGVDRKLFLARLERRLQQGIGLLQFRAHGLDQAAYAALAREVTARVHAHGARLLLNADPDLALRLGVGVHLTGRALVGCRGRPLPDDLLVAASCHDPAELRRAVESGVDFAVLGPVAATRSHPGTEPLGLTTYGDWIHDIPIPVYALGGMTPGDLEAVVAARGQGIAAISSLWRE